MPAHPVTSRLQAQLGSGWWAWLVCIVALMTAACGSSAGGHGAGADAGTGDGPSGGDAVIGEDGGVGDGNLGDGGGGDGGGNPLCGSCAAPPADTCEDGTHLRRYDSIAGCEGAACIYPSHVVDCPDGCANGACTPDACATIACAAPAPTCTGATLHVASASCTGGQCAMTYADTTCADGCANGACLGPTCGATTCAMPPASTCADAKVLTGFAELGTCSGTCSYAALQTLCSQGCFAGACEAGSTESVFMPPVPGPSGSTWRSNVAFAVDAAGHPHLAFVDGTQRLIWRHLDASGWHDVAIDTNLGLGVQVALALDPAGVPAVAYYEPTNQRLRYGELRGASFHLEEVSLQSPAGQFPSIAIDASGTRWIASNDGALGLRVAHGHAGSWTFESVGASYYGETQLAIAPGGTLHLVWGDRSSNATQSGSYYQPPAYHAARIGGSWQIDRLSAQGLVFKRGLAFATNGDALVAYGVVSAVGQNDELRVRRFGATASDVLVESIGNWLNTSPIGLYDARADLKFTSASAATLVRGAGDLWSTSTHDFPPNPLLLDVVDGPDGRPRFLSALSSNSPAAVSGYAFTIPPACVPSCTGATCGSDGCGGSCGTCGGGAACGPDRQCSPWLEETINQPELVTYPSRTVAFAMTPAGAHHMLMKYNFPERYYTSGSTQDELFYMTDANGPWALPAPELVVGRPMANYAQLAIVPTSLFADPSGVEATFAYGLAGYTWSIQHASPGAEPWAVARSTSSGQARPQLLDAARNRAGVEYTIVECGYYGDVACIYRHDAAGDTQETLTGDYAIAVRSAVDAAGHVHILWTHRTGMSSTSHVALEYATDESGVLVSTPIAGETTAGASDVFHPLLALGPHDEVHVAFIHVGGTEIHHGVWSAGALSIDVVPADPAAKLALAVAPDGQPYLLAAAAALKLWRLANATWTAEPIPTRGAPTTPWLAFDAAGKPHVVFGDSSAVSSQLRLGWRP